MKSIKIGKKAAGKGKCFIIAEAGVNHKGDINIAKRLVDAALKAGADAVKFQTFSSEKLVTKEASMAAYQKKNTSKKESQLEMLKKLELKLDDFRELKEYCDKKGILFLSTPHTDDVVDFLDKLVPAFKTGSGDLTNLPLLEKIARKKKPVILSTGMGTMEEVKEAVGLIRKNTDDVIVLQCTTNYPSLREDTNLKAMLAMEKELKCLVGYSDHTLGIDIPVMAASLGAAVVEKHFTLDKDMEGPDHKASADPEELKEMIRQIRQGKKPKIPDEIMGDGIKQPTPAEIDLMKAARKSIIAAKDIKKGQKITEDMLIIKRPGTGLEPKKLWRIIGRKAGKDIKKDQMISMGMLE